MDDSGHLLGFCRREQGPITQLRISLTGKQIVLSFKFMNLRNLRGCQ